eukprot:5899202-Alexandrium_andersonii.AAC.1
MAAGGVLQHAQKGGPRQLRRFPTVGEPRAHGTAVPVGQGRGRDQAHRVGDLSRIPMALLRPWASR